MRLSEYQNYKKTLLYLKMDKLLTDEEYNTICERIRKRFEEEHNINVSRETFTLSK